MFHFLLQSAYIFCQMYSYLRVYILSICFPYMYCCLHFLLVQFGPHYKYDHRSRLMLKDVILSVLDFNFGTLYDASSQPKQL